MLKRFSVYQAVKVHSTSANYWCVYHQFLITPKTQTVPFSVIFVYYGCGLYMCWVSERKPSVINIHPTCFFKTHCSQLDITTDCKQYIYLVLFLKVFLIDFNGCLLPILCLQVLMRKYSVCFFVSWYDLESRPGKKRKDRGKIQVSIQFIRNNMTASMFDLSMRDKPRSPFSKLKEKMKGRRHDMAFSDTSSAILPHSGQNDIDSLSDQQQHPQVPREPKPKRSLLTGTQKLSAAHSMSDLIGTHFRPKMDSVSSIEGKGENMHGLMIFVHRPFCQMKTMLLQKHFLFPSTLHKR